MEQDMITMDDEEQLSMTEIALNGISEFQQAMQLSSIESAVQLHREALLLRPTPNPQQYLSLLGLAGALIMQCYCTEKLQHLDEAIALLQEVLLLPSCPDLEFHCLLSLCFCYCLKFSQTADPYDMRDVVLSHMKANDGYQVAKGLLEDGTAMYKTFQELGQVSDLEEAVSLLQAALLLHPFPHPNRSLSLNNLSGALLTRFEQMGQFCDLEESISLNREALDMTSSSYPNQNRSLNNLANALLRQYEHIGYLPDLEESISLYREALKTPFDSDPSSSPNNLPTALMARFSQTGQLSDLEEAISLYREMLDLNPLLHPNRDSSLNNLANALKTRFEEMGQFCDVEESISLHREALGLRPPPNPDRPSTLNNLAGALMMKFEYMDDKMISEISNLEESITLSREALILRAPSSPYRPQSLNNLATALMRRFEQMSELSDLEESISFHREVVNLLSLTHPIRSTSLRNLANALWRKFQHTDQLCDLEESISSYKAGIKLLPINHPKHDLSEFLAKSLVDMYLVTKQPSYLSEAMTAFHKAVTLPSSSILHRFEAAKAWADYADVYDHSSALEAYQHAINLLPYLAALGMDLKARLAALSKANGLACDAASCAIEAGQLEKAVEFLSEGRAVFWTQALQLRNSFDELQSVKPELSDKLQSISAALEKASHRDSRNMGDINQNVGILEQEASHCRILNDEWNCTIDEVRKLNGFQNFLQPKPFHALQRAAKHGPIVLLNASRSGCDGLILTSDGVQHVPLPDITITTLQALCVTIKMALSFSGMRMELPDAADTMVETVVEKLRNHDYYTERGGRLSKPVQHDPQDLFRDVLGLLWFSVVHPVIQALGLQVRAVYLFFCSQAYILNYRSLNSLHASGGALQAHLLSSHFMQLGFMTKMA
jgi:tetratricopeptide (TPR) repeat protein